MLSLLSLPETSCYVADCVRWSSQGPITLLPLMDCLLMSTRLLYLMDCIDYIYKTGVCLVCSVECEPDMKPRAEPIQVVNYLGTYNDGPLLLCVGWRALWILMRAGCDCTQDLPDGFVWLPSGQVGNHVTEHDYIPCWECEYLNRNEIGLNRKKGSQDYKFLRAKTTNFWENEVCEQRWMRNESQLFWVVTDYVSLWKRWEELWNPV